MREAPDIPIVKIFSRTLGFHVYLEGEAPHPNCESWAVTPLSLSRSKRYLDAGVVNKIWAAVDNIIWTKMPYACPLRSKQAESPRNHPGRPLQIERSVCTGFDLSSRTSRSYGARLITELSLTEFSPKVPARARTFSAAVIGLQFRYL